MRTQRFTLALLLAQLRTRCRCITTLAAISGAFSCPPSAMSDLQLAGPLAYGAVASALHNSFKAFLGFTRVGPLGTSPFYVHSMQPKGTQASHRSLPLAAQSRDK